MDYFNFEEGMNILPKSDIVESGLLNGMLTNFSASYKIYWLKGIFTEVVYKNNAQISYKKIIARMIAVAWYPVIYYKLSLGHADKLSDAIHYVHNSLGISREEKEENIVNFVNNCMDPKLKTMIDDFTSNVPYRLIRPFYQEQLAYEKKNNPDFREYKTDVLIEQFNRSDKSAFYMLNDKEEYLTVSREWIYYLKLNAPIIEGWMNYKLIDYVQRRNPNVPAVPLKLFPPTDKDRNLSAETKFWTEIQKEIPLYDIYTETEFTEKNFRENGGLSIDHFIPWRFVRHNEIWNLYPMFRNANSSKNNKLPDKELYLNSFCEKQYQAFMVAKNWKRDKKLMDQYLHVKEDIFQIDGSDRGHEVFLLAMKQTIEPLYQIARNQGYHVWQEEN